MLETTRLKELALIGLRLEREQIEREIATIHAQLVDMRPITASDATTISMRIEPRKTKPRTISPEGRKKLSLLAKRRWKTARKNGKAAL
jgi:hypothetical protein